MSVKGFVRTKEGIKSDLVKLELGRDELLEWLLQNTQDSTTFRVYSGKFYILIGVNRNGNQAEL